MLSHLELEKIGVQFGRSAVLKSVSCTFHQNTISGIAGPNGSGKSTLLKIISGNLSPGKGQIQYYAQTGTTISKDDLYCHLSFSAPYMELPEELKFRELLDFVGSLSPWKDGLKTSDLLEISGLEPFADKKIKEFSSGMKQRAKLVSTILRQTDLLLLDEPTTNLDQKAKSWFFELLDQHGENRIVILASNEEGDLSICEQLIQLPS